MKVKDLIKNLSELHQDAEICIYDPETTEAVYPDSIVVANNDDDIPIEYHLYNSDFGEYNA